MKSVLVRASLPVLLAAMVVGGLPLATSQLSASDSLAAVAQTRSRRSTNTNTAIIPAGTELRVRLNNRLSSKYSRVGNRFTATVLGPEEYEGARVTGHVSSVRKSGRVTGRTSMALAFDSITLRGGRRGVMRAEVARLYDEESSTKVDQEGTVESGSRGKQTAKRSAIGGAAGAVLGGILGGGKGALVGLIVGGAAGAGSIAIEGSKELELPPGTQMLLRVTRR
jgi:outer membrane lipoprotein SlyB